MNERIELHGLSVAKELYDLVCDEIIPGTGVDPDRFWMELSRIVADLGPKNRALLNKRDELQAKIDEWHQANLDYQLKDYKGFLKKIGYLAPEGEPFKVSVANADAEITRIAGPQLVVPVDNSRYALNAANARWGSLYDALYSTDVIPEIEGCKRAGRYNPVRGRKVIDYTRRFLDRATPMAVGSHDYVVKYKVKSGQLIGVMGDGSECGLGKRERFAGYTGNPDAPDSILLRHNALHIELRFGEGYYIGRNDLAGVYDIQLEAAVSAIMDCEDSVSAVDASDKVAVYRNWLGLMKGDLIRKVVKGDEVIERSLCADRKYKAPNGRSMTLPGRALLLLRNVGLHMYTDAVTTAAGQQVPEGFLDAMVTTLAAKHDLLGNGRFRNSRTGSIYIVKPKLHGPEEVAATVELFERVEDALGLERLTIKIGIMDEERRTTVNLKECIRAAQDRVIFINTGFLDRTADEIHTSMEAGPMLPKSRLKTASWLLAYEDWNVDTGMVTGLPRHAQIGKGMWPEPDNMAAMMDVKVNHPRAGATSAWVPSPIAATLHAMHYHQINVGTRQRELIRLIRVNSDDLLAIPVLDRHTLNDFEIRKELENNAQGILGYVVRWIEHGIGCSKVPDVNNVNLMEDRATLRISSQHIANWFHHGIVTREQVIDAFKKMAPLVDYQNAEDHQYINMSPDFDKSIPFQAALDLVICGRDEPNGYTERVLHAHRREYKGNTDYDIWGQSKNTQQ